MIRDFAIGAPDELLQRKTVSIGVTAFHDGFGNAYQSRTGLGLHNGISVLQGKGNPAKILRIPPGKPHLGWAAFHILLEGL